MNNNNIVSYRKLNKRRCFNNIIEIFMYVIWVVMLNGNRIQNNIFELTLFYVRCSGLQNY